MFSDIFSYYHETYAVWEEPVDHGTYFTRKGTIYDKKTNNIVSSVISNRPKLTHEELIKASEPFEQLRAKMVREGRLPPAECDKL